MIDVYHATLHDLMQVALQSLFYFNYLKGGPCETGPSKSELHLRLALRKGNSRHCRVKSLCLRKTLGSWLQLV